MEEMTEKAKLNDLSFDTALKELEIRVKQLEDGKLPLEEALECFKEGIGLVRICSSKLKDAETVIQELILKDDGTIAETSPNVKKDSE